MKNERKITFEAAEDFDSAAILQLLSETGLPLDGVAEHLSDFTAARDESKRLVGIAGVERYGKTGLLRSVVVAPEYQTSGIGSQIVSAVLQKAQAEGIEEIVLLTMTARDFFARRFGFSETVRQRYEEILQNSPEWTLPRCSSAVVMRLDLNESNFGER